MFFGIRILNCSMVLLRVVSVCLVVFLLCPRLRMFRVLLWYAVVVRCVFGCSNGVIVRMGGSKYNINK